jgi:hypothetical protein
METKSAGNDRDGHGDDEAVESEGVDNSTRAPKSMSGKPKNIRKADVTNGENPDS